MYNFGHWTKTDFNLFSYLIHRKTIRWAVKHWAQFLKILLDWNITFEFRLWLTNGGTYAWSDTLYCAGMYISSRTLVIRETKRHFSNSFAPWFLTFRSHEKLVFYEYLSSGKKKEKKNRSMSFEHLLCRPSPPVRLH